MGAYGRVSLGRIPNLPFFYLCFRAWSHWKGELTCLLEPRVGIRVLTLMVPAWMGSQHLEFLLEKDLAKLTPSSILRSAYTKATSDAPLRQLQDDVQKMNEQSQDAETGEPPPERMLLSKTSGKIIADQLEVPALEVEMERAIWQVERGMKTEEDDQHERKIMPSSQKTER